MQELGMRRDVIGAGSSIHWYFGEDPGYLHMLSGRVQ